MAESWTIRELTPDEYPDTQLGYEVRDETGEVFSLHFWEEDARQMVAVPQMLEALKEALTLLRYKVGDNETIENQISAAIKAAMGE